MTTRGLFLAAAVVLASSCGPKPEKLRPRAAPRSPAQQKFDAGMAAAGAGQWAEAAEAFAACAELAPDNAAARVNQGIALERSGDLEAAMSVYRAVLDLEPDNPDAATNLARTLVALGEVREARKVVAGALKNNEEDLGLLNTYAGVLRLLGRFEPAAEAARQVLLRDQRNAAAIKTLALIYADEGQLTLAEMLFENALAIDEKDASVRVNLGRIAHERGEHQKAIAELEEALEIDPGNAVANANIGAIALRFRDYERAAAAYQNAIGAGMLNCTTAAALGYAFEGAMKAEEAVAQLSKAYDLCQDAELLYAMGNICMAQLRDNDCALEKYRAYAREQKKLAEDHPVFMMIQSIEELENMEEAGPVEAPESDVGEEPAPEGAAPVSQAAGAGAVTLGDATPAPSGGGLRELRAKKAADEPEADNGRSALWMRRASDPATKSGPRPAAKRTPAPG